MNYAKAQRDLLRIDDRHERRYERQVQRIMATFEVDHNTAALVSEYLELKLTNFSLACFCGLVSGGYTHAVLTPILQARSLLFKKVWMVPVVPLIAFTCGFMGGNILTGKRFNTKDMNFERMSGSNDILSRFRKTQLGIPDTNSTTENENFRFLKTSVPTSRDQVINYLQAPSSNIDPFLRNKQVKRVGKDKDDFFYMFGKIHGLENIAFLSKEELDKIRNPIDLQLAVNNVDKAGKTIFSKPSFDAALEEAMKDAQGYKQTVMQMNIYPSERAKLLALPFFMNRRVQNPDPIKGTWQWELFKEFSGYDWDAFAHYEYDPEDKYSEKDIPKGLLEKIDQESPYFKKELRKKFLLTPTTFERHQELQKTYRGLMPILNELTEEEGYAFYHLISNGKSDDYIEYIHGGHKETKLAKIAEKANYEKRNRHWLQKTKMNFLRPEKAPISQAKIKDVFKNSPEFRARFDADVGIYDTERSIYEHEKKILNMFNKMSNGVLVKLGDEIGLRRDRESLSFLRYSDFEKIQKMNKTDPTLDKSYNYFFNSQFMPLDMLDYYDDYAGFGELMPAYEIGFDPNHANMLISSKRDYDFTQDENGFDVDYIKPNFFLSADDEEAAAEEDEDDDDDEEGEGEEEEEKLVFDDNPIKDERFKDGLNDEPDWPVSPAKYRQPIIRDAPIYFDEFEQIQDRFNDMELEGFARLLDVKPFINWQDNTHYMDRVGAHSADDFAQMVDPEHKLAGEIEREIFERMIFTKHRNGPIIRFSVGDKRPKFMTSDE